MWLVRSRFQLAALLAFAACRCAGTEAPPPDAGTPKVAPKARLGGAVSMLAMTNARCSWQRVDLSTSKVTTEISFEGSCGPGLVAFSLDGRTVAFVTADPASKDGLAIEIAAPGAHRVTLAPPPLGALREIGFDPAGRLLALMAAPLATGALAKTVTFEGKELEVPATLEGAATLVHAFVRAEPTWTLLETRVVGADAALSGPNGALASAKVLGARSPIRTDDDAPGKPLIDDPAVSLLAPAAPETAKDDRGQWYELSGAEPRVFVWRSGSGFIQATSRVVSLDGADVRALPTGPRQPQDPASVSVAGPWVIVSDRDGGRSLVIDARSGLVTYEGPVRSAMFWPSPR